MNLALVHLQKAADGTETYRALSHHLGSYDQETLKACADGGGDFDNKNNPLNGKLFNYTNVQSLSDLPICESYVNVPADPSLIRFCDNQKVTLLQALEVMDPSHRYLGQEGLDKTDALERQLIRFGHIQPRRRGYGHTSSFTLSAAVANTPANQLYFPAAQARALFMDPILDQDLDANMLFSGTSTSKERTYKQIRVDDSQFRHMRIPSTGVGEQAEFPTSNITTYGYAGNMIKHGMAYSYSREFALYTSFDFAQMAFARASIKERIAYFNHVLDTVINGNTAYGLLNGVTPTTAYSLDPTNITGDGQLSFLSQLSHLYGMRPYRPMAFCNISTYHSFLQAVPPKNMVDTEILRALVGNKGYPDMPRPVDQSFLQFTPQVKVVPDTSMATNLILYMDTAHAIGRKVLANGNWSDLIYNGELQRYKQIFSQIDGVEILPAFYESAKVLSLTIA